MIIYYIYISQKYRQVRLSRDITFIEEKNRGKLLQIYIYIYIVGVGRWLVDCMATGCMCLGYGIVGL